MRCWWCLGGVASRENGNGRNRVSASCSPEEPADVADDQLAVRPGSGAALAFRAYYMVRLDDASVSITVCDDEAGTAESTRVAGDWLRENMPEAAPSPPMVSSGTVTISA